MCFIYIYEASESVNRTLPWQVLACLFAPLQNIKNMYGPVVELVRKFNVEQGLVLNPFLSNIFLAKVLVVGIPGFSKDADILVKLDHFQEQLRDVRTDISMDCPLFVVYST